MASNSGTWDLPSVNFRSPNIGSSSSFNNFPAYNSNSMLSTPIGRVFTNPAPPVPARPVRSTLNSGYNSYSSPINSYGGFNNYGGYGYYGGYRPGYNSFGFGSSYYGNCLPENRFIQLAEESSRPAFQTIQSILQAFSSVTMMFESSFHAIYSSYMSVLGVADNFSKLQSVFSQVFSTFAVVRALNWIFRKLLYMLGINREGFSKESIWSEALGEVSTCNSDNKTKKKRTWPLLIFMSLLMGGPYLLFKLMNELYPNPVREVWVPAEQPGSLAIGLYDFHAASEQELSFQAQQKLLVAPKKYQPNDCPGWLLACNENRKIGLVPNNYLGVVMQSEKTGQTYIEHNNQTYYHPSTSSNIEKNIVENNEKTVKDKTLHTIDNGNQIEEAYQAEN